MKKRRYLAMLLCGVCLLAGCGKQGPQPGMPSARNLESAGGQRGEESLQGQDSGTKGEPLGGSPGEPLPQPEMEGEITVSCLYQQDFLTEAAREFTDLYPQVKVTVNTFDQGGSGEGNQEYQNYLNTRLMTGNGEDILFTQLLPVERYIRMGIFEDLSPYLAGTPQLNEENYYMNVLTAARREDGSLYLVPYMARFDAVGFSRELLDRHPEVEESMSGWDRAAYSQAVEAAGKLIEDAQGPNIFLNQDNELIYAWQLIRERLDEFLDREKGEVTIDTQAYRDLLAQAREAGERGCFPGDGLNYYNIEYDFGCQTDFDVQAAYYELDQRANQAHTVPLADAQGRVGISAFSCIALNSASPHKELARESVTYLLSSQVQTKASIYGLAVNREGFEASVKRYYNNYHNGNSGSQVELADYRELLDGWMRLIDSCNTLDDDIQELINGENRAYFEGRQTAEETSRHLQERLTQYFQE